jgi:sugar diacid utilization regulator
MMKLPVGNRLRLLSDGSGLDRTIRWTHYVEEPGYLKFLRGGELVLTTGLLVQTTDKMVDFIRALDEKGCAGMVLSTDTPLGELPYVRCAVEMANTLHFDIFLLPWEIGMVELCQVICKEIVEREMSKTSLETLMNYLLYNDVPLDDKTIDSARAFGYAKGRSCVSAIVSVVHPVAASREERQRHGVRAIVQDIYRKAREKDDDAILHLVKENQVVFIIPANAASKLVADVVETNALKNPHLRITAGIGPVWTDLNQFRRSAQIAEKLLAEAGGKSGKSDKRVVDFSELALERLLYGQTIDTKEIAEIVDLIFMNLNGCRESSRDELKRILKAYLENMCNLTETARELFMHVNTLRYKIHRIEELCGGSIRNPETYFRFCLGFRLEEFIRRSVNP